MRVTYNWLKRFLPALDVSADKLADTLTFIGLEVEKVEDLGGDWAFEVDVTSNRPDCLSALGVAREVAAALRLPLQLPKANPPFSGPKTRELTDVIVLEPQLCPRYSAHLILGVEIAPSPQWLVEALVSVGIRPVNNVVDATNFVTMELGQPLHAFDFDRLYERRIVVRRAEEGEEILAIDGRIYPLDKEMLLIADARFPAAIAGVMGGKETEVTEKTRNVLLESALFEPLNIRKTSKKLGLVTAASYRFSRGVDPEMVVFAARRAAQLILQLAGGTLATEPIDVREHTTQQKTVSMRFGRIKTIMGVEIAQEEALQTLKHLGFEVVEQTEEKLTVRVPSWRSDIEREIDLIEEVARIHGFEDIHFVKIPFVPVRLPKPQRIARQIREIMAACGFLEAMSDVFVKEEELSRFCPFGGEAVRVRNPVRADMPILRSSLIPTLLAALHHNQNYASASPDLFELSTVFYQMEGNFKEVQSLCALSCHTFRRVKGALEEVARRLGVKIETEPEDVAILEPGAGGVVKLAGRKIGICGMLKESLREAVDLRESVYLFEVDASAFIESARLVPRFRPLPRLPTIQRDIAVIVDKNLLWRDVASAIQSLGIEPLFEARLFDVYFGKPVPEGKKSMAIRLLFGQEERPLSGREVDEMVNRVVAELERRFSAKLRGKEKR